MKSAVATISSDQLTAGISPFGAELQHLTTSNGRELLWDGNPTYWTGKAPILFPVIGVLQGGYYRLDGKFYLMPKHGFARHSTFDIVESATDAATFRLTASGNTRSIYPFEFQLDIRFFVAGIFVSEALMIVAVIVRVAPATKKRISSWNSNG